jgi:hypothetical protein
MTPSQGMTTLKSRGKLETNRDRVVGAALGFARQIHRLNPLAESFTDATWLTGLH